MSESDFQKQLIDELRIMFPDCVILKNDASYLQGIPDLVIFYGDRYAFLEVKASEKARRRPNQPYWVDRLDEMSFARFIHPSNKQEVLSDLQRAWATR